MIYLKCIFKFIMASLVKRQTSFQGSLTLVTQPEPPSHPWTVLGPFGSLLFPGCSLPFWGILFSGILPVGWLATSFLFVQTL